MNSRGLLALFARAFAFGAALVLGAGVGTAGSHDAAAAGVAPDLPARVDAIVGRAMRDQKVVGMSVAVGDDGRLVYAAGYGYRNLAKRLPATAHTIYNIASMTKQFTAACIMLLQQDGKLKVDDPVSKYFPGFPGAGVLTLRNLLNHTSGLQDYLEILDVNRLSMPAILAALEKTKLRYKPGTRFEYSNSNYVVLGAVVSKVSGMPFDAFLTQRILKPLALASTSIGTAPVNMSQGSLGYTVSNGRQEVTPPQGVAVLDYPDGGVNATAGDLVKWDFALDSGRVVDQKLLAMMFAPGPHGSEVTFGYGFGLRIKQLYGHREICHTGGWTGYTGENATFPDDHLAIVILTNTDTFNKEYVVDQIFALFHPPTPAQAAAQRQSAAGENPTVTPRARAVLAQLETGHLERAWLSARLRHDLTPNAAASLEHWLVPYGQLERMVFVDRDADPTGVYEDYRLFYPDAVISYSLRLDATGRIAEIDLSRED